MSKLRRSTVTTAGILASMFMVASTVSPASDERQSLTDNRPIEDSLLFDAMFANGRALSQAAFSGTETVEIRMPDNSFANETARFSGAFDFNTHQFRFAYKSASNTGRDYVYFESSSGRVMCSHGTKFKIFRGPVKQARDRPREFFDVRCLGLMTNTELRRGLMPELRKLVINATIATTERKLPDDNRHELTRTTAGGYGHIRHELDAARDFAPVLMEMRYRKNPDAPLSQVMKRVKVTWQTKGQLDVPHEVVMESSDSKGLFKTRRLTIAWQTLNQPLAPELFDHEKVPLVPGTKVVDHATDPANPVVIEEITAD